MTIVDTDILIDVGRGIPEAIACLKDIKANPTAGLKRDLVARANG